ncbi:hypothetical protein [Pengzhenrongella phosphoraccumulans]|uniref:hypothetical protein n=1 Tax=Pengzhenrongella phosphoraccumulans TaxID=3114394 RepID=UPI0038901DA9
MTERVQRAVTDAIADAIVDLEASAGERVRFDPDQLTAVRALSRDSTSREAVLAILRERLSVAILAMEPASADPPDWHDAQAAQALLSLIESEDVPGSSVPG